MNRTLRSNASQAYSHIQQGTPHVTAIQASSVIDGRLDWHLPEGQQEVSAEAMLVVDIFLKALSS